MSDNGVEPIKELFERVYVLLKELNEKYTENETVLLVTHNGVNLAVSSILNGMKENIFEYNLKPCEYRVFNNVDLKKWEGFCGEYKV